MALCGGVGALALPSELIVHIFSFLSDWDKLRASAVCSRWRECLFYPALWTDLKLRLGGATGGGGSGPGETPKLEFLMRKFGSFVRELELEFAPVEGYPSPVQGAEPAENDPQFPARWKEAMDCYLDQVLCVLRGLRNNRNLQKLSMYGSTCILLDEDFLESTYSNQDNQESKKLKEIQQLFEQVLANSRQMKWLGCAFMLGMVTPSSLSALSNLSAGCLEHLGLLNAHAPPLLDDQTPPLPDGLPPPLLRPLELERLPRLRSLALDFHHFTSGMCRALAGSDHAPLLRLSLLLAGTAPPDAPLEDTPSEEDWRTLAQSSAGLRVYLMALDARSEDLLKVLKPSLPLERFHFDSYAVCSAGTLELICLQYHRTLTHFTLVRDDARFPDLSENHNEDPLVLLAWRCKCLSLLVLHGYTVWAHNLIAISRLRGHRLSVLEVQEESIHFDAYQGLVLGKDPMHHLTKEVSLSLGRAWSPALESSILLNDPTQHFYREAQIFSAGM
ncbi:F-box only protein 33-like [Megalops cyprinoides]|uniref:F-box only protein 33-like n=1 Tax=Megalops cyprinoides TaxID=118141 RepID=UPI0018641779|nr:F-box only protein 33-like [Megalops cyprinoides]